MRGCVWVSCLFSSPADSSSWTDSSTGVLVVQKEDLEGRCRRFLMSELEYESSERLVSDEVFDNVEVSDGLWEQASDGGETERSLVGRGSPRGGFGTPTGVDC